MCERVVCKSGVCVCERETAGGRRSGRECTTKNKNPTTRCGEKHHQFCFLHCIFYILKILHIFVVTFISCSLTGHIYIIYIYLKTIIFKISFVIYNISYIYIDSFFILINSIIINIIIVFL